MDTQLGDPRTTLANDRTNLAKFRTQLALDRTTLAWIRTALSLSGFGFGTVGFFRSLRLASPTPESVQLHASAIRFGVALIVLGVVATVLSSISHWFALRRLRRHEAPVLSRWPVSITVALMLGIIGLVALFEVLSRP